MKIAKITLLCIVAMSFINCASSYKMITPKFISYKSVDESTDVKFEYKYDLLHKKYKKKEQRKGIKLVAVKVSNNSGKDITFGKDAKLVYKNGSEATIIENEKVFKSLKQHPATHLFYLLLTPVNLYVTSTNANGIPEQTSSIPIGLGLGPGLAGGNIIAASSANKNFKKELLDYNLDGVVIKNGETKYGLVAIKSNSFDALKLKIDSNQLQQQSKLISNK